MHGERGNSYKMLAQKAEGKRPLGRPTHRWEDNIERYLKQTEYEVVDRG
jgi:hypothetical protein